MSSGGPPPGDPTTVLAASALRELLESRLGYEREFALREIEHQQKMVQKDLSLLDQRLDMTEEARKIQAVEYERRLTVLNHAHEAAVEAQAKTVPREMWEAFVKEHELFKAETISHFAEITTQFSIISTRTQTWVAIVGALFAILNVLIRFWPTPFVVR